MNRHKPKSKPRYTTNNVTAARTHTPQRKSMFIVCVTIVMPVTHVNGNSVDNGNV